MIKSKLNSNVYCLKKNKSGLDLSETESKFSIRNNRDVL